MKGGRVAPATTDLEDDTSWYLAQLKPGGLQQAREHLERQGFETFMPLHNATIRRRGKLDTVKKPLFPGYLFVRVDVEQYLRPINATRGVSRLVSMDGKDPVRVPTTIIVDLQSQTNDGDWLPKLEKFEIGQGVEIVSGPFAGFQARISAISEVDRIFVLLDMIGRLTRISVPRRACLPV